MLRTNEWVVSHSYPVNIQSSHTPIQQTAALLALHSLLIIHLIRKTNINPDPNPIPNRYRRGLPDLNAGIEKLYVI